MILSRPKTADEVAGRVACLLGSTGHLDVPNLATILVEAALSEPELHDEVVAFLRTMLATPRFVTEARKALVKGLESDDKDVICGAVRTLWEAGIRTDSELPTALVGLLAEEGPVAKQASDWLAELLRNPWTHAESLAASEEAIKEALDANKQDSTARQRKLTRAWRIGQALAALPTCRSELLVDAIVFGGLVQRSRHDDAIRILEKLTAEGPEASRRIEDQLWQALQDELGDVGWGAVVALGRLFGDAFSRAAAEAATQEERVVGIVRVLLRQRVSERLAASTLDQLTGAPDKTTIVHAALANILRDKDEELAFGAARYLIERGIADHSAPLAVVAHGLGHWQREGEANETIERLWGDAILGPSVRYALRRATWGGSDASASMAALIMVEQKATPDPGMVRGLALGLDAHHRHRPPALQRLRELLRDPAHRTMALETLRVELHGEHRGQRFAVAALLVEAGAELDAPLLSELSARSEHWPHGPLAVLAHSDRVAEARGAAQRLGFSSLAALLT